MLFDAAMARVAGEFIIQHVENQIINEYEDYKKQMEKEIYFNIQKQKQDEERMLFDIQQQRQEQDNRRIKMMREAEEEAEK